jgi:dipeptidyl aminopeptidase/acylaminoacyl peptidase
MFRALSATLTIASIACIARAPAAEMPLASRDLFFHNPVKLAPAVSPDGRRIAYLAPATGGVFGIWVRTLGLDDAKLVASDPHNPIGGFLWQGDSRHILYLRTNGSSAHVVVVNASTGQARDLTPDPSVRANIEDVDPAEPGTILISTNQRDKSLLDVYRLDVERGGLVLDTRNPGNVDEWFPDNAMFVRAAIVRDRDGSSVIEVRDNALSPWRTLVTFGPDDGFTDPVAFSADDRSLYVIDSKDSNAAQLVRYDLATGKPQTLASDPAYDVTAAFVDPHTHALAAAAIERERVSWSALDPQYGPDLAALGRVHEGDVEIEGGSADGKTWIVAFNSDDAPKSYYAYNRTTRSATFLFVAQPELSGLSLAKMQPISFQARDGLTLHGYITLPAGVVPHALPTVLLVHGGPWARDSWGYNGLVQWLANRGYAVLQLNFRGSTGYGRAFEAAGNKEWAGSMRTDLVDAREWSIKAGYTDPARVAIMGASYGGYATLAALAFTPGLFACGVDVSGMSDLDALLAAVSKQSDTLRASYGIRMGFDATFLRSQSPLFIADRISAPLLVGQGANDPRVPLRETDRLVATLRTKHVPVAYVVFPDEGHGFAHPENNRRFNALIEDFLGRNLGGRAERAHAGETLDPFLR